jgi:sec-independent protein translocase protein TatB
MFDLGWTEILVIGIVALIVVGPKDLPGMFRTVGQFVGKAKGMAREFSKAMNDAADDAGVSGMSDSLRKATNPIGSAMDEVRKSTKSFTQSTRDAGKPKTKLSPERQEAKDKIAAHSAKATQERLDREKAEARAADGANAAAAKSVAPAQDGPTTPPTAEQTAEPAAVKKSALKKPAATKAKATAKAEPKPQKAKSAAAKPTATKTKTAAKPVSKTASKTASKATGASSKDTA